jgi:hypothetical protein
VSRYKATNCRTVPGELPVQFKERYPDSVCAVSDRGRSMAAIIFFIRHSMM